MFTSRKSFIGAIVAAGVLAALSAVVQMQRDRLYATDRPEQEVLYVQSPAIMKRLTLSYDALIADVYWIRALQHFGRQRQSNAPTKNYELLYPLLDLTTSLDSRFNLAYRFGAIFLSEQPPGGPGRPDQAIALLEKGIAAMPGKWQYYQDAGFVYYWARQDYTTAAEWFVKGSKIEGSPWWMKSLAANTLAKGNDRLASRVLYSAMLESAEIDFMRQDAARRLRQLDALDALDLLNGAIQQRYLAAGGQRPVTWKGLIDARILRGVPRDPDGFEYALDPNTARVDLHQKSTLRPLPNAPAAGPPPF